MFAPNLQRYRTTPPGATGQELKLLDPTLSTERPTAACRQKQRCESYPPLLF